MGFARFRRYATARRLRWVAGALVLWAGWSAVEPWLFNTEYYRDLLETRLAEATGLDANIGAMDFSFLPAPMFRAADLRLTGEDVSIAVERVDLAVEVRALPTRRLEILDLRARHVTVQAPQDPRALEASGRSLLENVRAFAARPRSIRGKLHRVEADNIRVALGKNPPALVAGHVIAEELHSSQPRFEVAFAAPGVGTEARVTLQGAFNRSSDNWGDVNGTGRISGVEAATMFALANLEGQTSADLTFSHTGGGLRVDVNGRLDAAPSALAGPLQGTLWWRDGLLVVNDFQLDAPEFNLALEATRYNDGRWALRIPEARAGARALNAFLGEQATTTPDTTATAQNWLLARDAAGWRTVAGSGLLHAWRPSPENAPEVALAADYALSERGIQIGGKDKHGLQWRATITPADLHWRTLHIAGAGSAPVTHPWIRERLPENVDPTAGTVHVTDFNGVYRRGESHPLQWSTGGFVDAAAVSIRATEKPLTFTNINGAFRSDSRRSDVDLHGTGGDWGPWTANGAWEQATRSWTGAVRLDVPRVAAQWEAVNKQQERLAPVLQAFGESTLDVAATFPKETNAPITLRATRHGTPNAVLEAQWRRTDQATELADFNLALNVPADTLRAFAPEQTHLEGLARVTVAREGSGNAFHIHGDLDDARIGMGWWLDKHAGTTFTVAATTGGGKLARLELQSNGQQLAFVRANDRLVAQDAALELAALTSLTPFADAMQGTVRGRVALEPFEGDIVFANASASHKSGPAIESVSGSLSWTKGRIELRDLDLAAAQSKLLLNGRREDGRWTGAVSGPKLHASAGAEWLEQVTALIKRQTPDSAAQHTAVQSSTADVQKRAKQPFLGELNINMDQVLYRRADFHHFQAKLTGDANELRLDDVQFRPNSGTVTGQASVLYQEDGRLIRAKLQGDTIDARILDEVLFEEPRGIFGVVNAALELETPWGDTKTMLNGLDGTVQWRAKDGSWGRMGFATRLLTALNATDIFRLKKPDFRDRGLTYNSCSGMLVFAEGVMQLRDVEMRAPVFTLTAAGAVDYPLDAADVAIRVAPLAGVNRRFADVPVLRDVVQYADRLTDVRLRMTGSPFDPDIALASGF